MTTGSENRPDPGAADGHVGLCDLFKIGIGPSSSHTVGPMKAAGAFIRGLDTRAQAVASRVEATAFGSLAWTGKGHGTDSALVLGLAGYEPHSINPREVDTAVAAIAERRAIVLPNGRSVPFDAARDVVFDVVRVFPRQPNAMIFRLIGDLGILVEEALVFYWRRIRRARGKAGGARRFRERGVPVSDCERSARDREIQRDLDRRYRARE